MSRVALTLWFTITALLGPGVCCCSFAAVPHSVTPTSVDGRPVPAKVPVRSCCHQEAPPCGDQGRPQPSGPVKPSKCPCEHGKQAKPLPPSGVTNADLVAHLRLLDTLFVGILLWTDPDLAPPTSGVTDTSQPVIKPYGRDLLAVYSLLRC